jgi:hypothetical protein
MAKCAAEYARSFNETKPTDVVELRKLQTAFTNCVACCGINAGGVGQGQTDEDCLGLFDTVIPVQ